MFQNQMMCPSCNERIDTLRVDCPHCHTHNVEYDKLKLSESALNVKWYFQLIFFLAGWIGVQVIAGVLEIGVLIFSRIPVEQLSERMDVLAPIQFITYGLEFVAMVVLLILSKGYKGLYRPFVSQLHGEESYIAGILGFVVLFIVSFSYEYLLATFHEDTSTNQALIIEMVDSYPILCIIFLGILGPICEEITYRVGLFGLLRRWNRLAAYLIGIFVFAFIHFDISSLLNIVMYKDLGPFINELLNFPAYLIGGAGLVILYDLFGIGASTTAHILNNVMSIGQIMVVCYVIR